MRARARDEDGLVDALSPKLDDDARGRRFLSAETENRVEERLADPARAGRGQEQVARARAHGREVVIVVAPRIALARRERDDLAQHLEGQRAEPPRVALRRAQHRERARLERGLEEVLALSNLCAYTSFTTVGEVGRTYGIEAILDEDTVRSVSRLNPPVPLDSLWFGIPGNVDTLGILYGLFDDPDSLGNAYRLSAGRVGKDDGFLYPTQSAFDDVFFNGVQFEFSFFRPVTDDDFDEDADPAEIGFYKVGDTVAVRWDHIDRGVYEAISSMEEQIQSQGSPFANPADVRSNIEGGIGLWAAYSPFVDTVICIP